MNCTPVTACCLEGSTVANMARVEADGSLITQATVSSITWKSFDLCDRDTTVGSGTLTVTDVVFDSLQTDDRWTEDSTGYNFRHDVPGTNQADGDTIYRYEYKVTMTAGGVFYLTPFDVAVTDVLSE